MNKTPFRTNSLQLAAYLNSRKELHFIGVNKEDPKSISFIFEPLDKAEKLADAYFSNNAEPANPLELFQNFESLKDLVFQIKRSKNPLNEWFCQSQHYFREKNHCR